MSYIAILIFLFFFLYSCSSEDVKPKRSLIINALDSGSILSCLNLIKIIQVNNILDSIQYDTTIYFNTLLHDYNDSTDNIKNEIMTRMNYKEQSSNLKYEHNVIDIKPLVDKNIGRPNTPPELVTFILESIYKVSKISSLLTNNNNNNNNGKELLIFNRDDDIIHQIVVLSIDQYSELHATKKFQNIFDQLDTSNLFLLQKTRRLTSPSNWHDLSIMALVISNKDIKNWFNKFVSVYLRHAKDKCYDGLCIGDREAFTLLDPRPALLESIFINRNKVKLSYLNLKSIFIIPKLNNVIQPFVFDSPMPHMIQISCKYEHHNHLCSIIEEPTHWRRAIDHHNIPKTYKEKSNIDNNKWVTNLPEATWKGSLKFWNTTSKIKPRSFCWDEGSSTIENPPDARLYNEDWNSYSKYYKPNPLPIANKDIKILILTGSVASARKIDEKLDLTLSKVYYAARHGYKFQYYFSDQFVHYFVHNLFLNIPNDMAKTDYWRGIMTKPIMVADAMLMNPDQDWIMWTDDDVFLNPNWAFLPLDIYLNDVADDKVFISGNYRSAFTNIFFVRNNEIGRRLVYDWVAITMSGHIQCHGFDQAALGTLILLRLYGEMIEKPFNHTCLYTQDDKTGCNTKGDWSCDFKFEKTAYSVGFRTKMAYFFGMKISSFSKGCANEFFPEFHVTFETKLRPRLQCGHCSRINQIGAAKHYDGPLGGGNDAIRRNAINGWHFGHKGEWLLWDSSLNLDNCLKIDNMVPICSGNSEEIDYNDMDVESNENGIIKNVISIVDGYAFDINSNSLCKLVDKDMIHEQIRNTYMNDYPEVIASVSKLNKFKWLDLYHSQGQGDGRHLCKHPSNINTNSCDHGEGSDGIAYMDRNIDICFEDKYFCEQCKIKQVDNWRIDRINNENIKDKTKKITDCRTDAVIINEKERDVNQDVPIIN